MLFDLKQSKSNQQVKLATPVDTGYANDELSSLQQILFKKRNT